MKSRGEAVPDMMTLARLHAALDSVLDTEQMITHIRESSATLRPGVVRIGQLVAETRELLRALLAPPEARHAVGNLVARQRPDGS